MGRIWPKPGANYLTSALASLLPRGTGAAAVMQRITAGVQGAEVGAGVEGPIEAGPVPVARVHTGVPVCHCREADHLASALARQVALGIHHSRAGGVSRDAIPVSAGVVVEGGAALVGKAGAVAVVVGEMAAIWQLRTADWLVVV